MKKNVINLLTLSALLVLPTFADSDGPAKSQMSPFCGAPMEPCPDGPAIFDTRGKETCSITIGGLSKSTFQFVDVNDEISGTKEPEEYQNFVVQHFRLLTEAKLAESWTGVMNIDLSACSCPQVYIRDVDSTGDMTLDSSCLCAKKCSFSVDKAYIQKTVMDATLRFGYQKVNFGAEENTPDEHLKTIYRSVATHFFSNLGLRASSGTETQYKYGGERFGGRHTGIFVAGQISAFHYTGALVNGYQGLCCSSNDLNNALGAYASIAMDFGIDCVDFLAGVNGGYQPKGANNTAIKDLNVWAVNPYLFANIDRLSLMAEAFYGSVQNADVTDRNSNSNPWGFNLIGSFMVNDNLELVGRFAYVNSDNMGMTIHNTFGCAPDKPFNTATEQEPSNANPISSQILFEKVYAGYLGVNYYMLNGAVKASLGLEQAKYKNRANSQSVGQIAFNDIDNKGAKVNCVRAAVQFLF